MKPDSGYVHLVLAQHFLAVTHDSEQARLELDLARRTLPNCADLELASAQIARTQGRWDEAIRTGEKAVSLQPRSAAFAFDLAATYHFTRRYADAERVAAHLMALEPDDIWDRLSSTTGAIEERADLGPLRQALATVIPRDESDAGFVLRYRLLLALCARDFDLLSQVLAGMTSPHATVTGTGYPKAWIEGLAARMRGDTAQAQVAFTAARAEVETALRAEPDEARLTGLLAIIDAGLGRKEEAMHEATQACALMPVERSAIGAPLIACDLAVVYAWTDQPERALDLLADLATRNAGQNLLFQPTYGDLRLNPVWDPLRKNPRFEAIIQELAPDKARLGR